MDTEIKLKNLSEDLKYTIKDQAPFFGEPQVWNEINSFPDLIKNIHLIPSEIYFDLLTATLTRQADKYNDRILGYFFWWLALSVFLLKSPLHLIKGTLPHMCIDIYGEAQMVGNFGAFKLVIYPKDHEPPHFHIKTEYLNLKFTINDCQQLGRSNKYLKSSDIKVLKEWHSKNKAELIAIWNHYQSLQ